MTALITRLNFLLQKMNYIYVQLEAAEHAFFVLKFFIFSTHTHVFVRRRDKSVQYSFNFLLLMKSLVDHFSVIRTKFCKSSSRSLF